MTPPRSPGDAADAATRLPLETATSPATIPASLGAVSATEAPYTTVRTPSAMPSGAYRSANAGSVPPAQTVIDRRRIAYTPTLVMIAKSAATAGGATGYVDG